MVVWAEGTKLSFQSLSDEKKVFCVRSEYLRYPPATRSRFLRGERVQPRRLGLVVVTLTSSRVL